MSHTAHSEQYRGLTITIAHDEYPTNPRGKHAIADHLGTFYGWARDFISPDPRADISDLYDFRQYLKERRADRHSTDPGVIGLVVKHSDHLGEWETTGDLADLKDDDQPDGVIFAKYEDIRRDQQCKRITPAVRSNVLDVLRAEVAEYSAWATGNAWIVQISTNGELVDTCGGFLGDWDAGDGDGWILEDARQMADGIANLRDRGVNDEEADRDMAGEIAELTKYYAA